MEPVARRPARRLALGATLASGLVVLAASAAALWIPGDPGLSTTRTSSGQAVVTWVAPNGLAWSADILPGDHIVSWDGTRHAPRLLTVRSGSHIHVVGIDVTTPALLDVVIAVLGCSLLGLGALVLGKSPDVRAAWAYWRLCLLTGLAVGVAAAGIHGLGWALAVEFVALRLLGPALLELALVLPTGREAVRWLTGWRAASRWAVPAVLLALYPFCWLWPVPLFVGVQLAGGVFLMGAIIAACGRIVVLWHQTLTEPQRAQLHYVAIGVVGGFTPLLLFALLPVLLVRHPLASPELLICALVLFPVSVGMAIVRHEFLGVPSLLYRRTLHLVLQGVLLATVALLVGLLLTLGPQQGGWTRVALTVGATVLLVLLVTQWARLVRKAERLLLPDTYEPLIALHRLHKKMFLAKACERGPALLRVVGDDLDLRFAVLQTARQLSAQGHPREPLPDAVLEAVAQRAQALLTTSAVTESWEEQITGLPVRIMPIRDRKKVVRAVLCIGPKHSGDTFTPQDEEMLAVLHDDLEAPFFYQQGEAQSVEETDEDEQADGTLPDIVLTAKHMEVLTYAAQNWTTKKIAETLKRDETTVEKRFTSLYRRMGVHNRKEAVALAHRLRLLPPSTTSTQPAQESMDTNAQGCFQMRGSEEPQEGGRNTPEETGL